MNRNIQRSNPPYNWIVIGILCGFLAGGCGKTAPSDVLIYGRGGDSVTFDPAAVEDGESAKVLIHIMEGLVRFKDDSTEIEPCLAESWDISEDGRDITFHLRPNVHFHDGTAFDSQAVVFTFERMLNAEHAFAPVGDTYPGFAFKPYIKLVDALDSQTVRFQLNEPYAPIFKNLAIFTGYIVSPAAFEKMGQDFGNRPVGTGPYKLVEWTRNATIELQRFDEYWGKAGVMPRIIFRSIPDGAVRLLGLQRGELHIIDGIEPQLVSKIRSNKDLVLLEGPGQNVGFVGFNVTVPPYDDVRVRRALNHAVNKEQICEYLFEGLAVPAKGVLPEGVLGYAPQKLPAYEYNPEKAKQLLSEAGYPDGFETKLTTYTIPRPYNPMDARLAELIQEDLAKVGVKVTIEKLEWGRYLEAVRSFEAPFALRGWSGDNADPDNFLWTRLGEPDNPSRYKNPRFIELMHEGVATFDGAERARIYQEAERIAVEDAPWIFLNHFKDLAAARVEVKGFQLHPLATHRLWGVSLQP